MTMSKLRLYVGTQHTTFYEVDEVDGRVLNFEVVEKLPDQRFGQQYKIKDLICEEEITIFEEDIYPLIFRNTKNNQYQLPLGKVGDYGKRCAIYLSDRLWAVGVDGTSLTYTGPDFGAYFFLDERSGSVYSHDVGGRHPLIPLQSFGGVMHNREWKIDDPVELDSMINLLHELEATDH